jgi:hypothetical protein
VFIALAATWGSFQDTSIKHHKTNGDIMRISNNKWEYLDIARILEILYDFMVNMLIISMEYHGTITEKMWV